MKIKITGIHGYLGRIISKQLKQDGHQVAGIIRELLYGSVANLAKELRGCEVIINLAGASILQRWTDKNKKLIYDSRIETTRNLVAAVNQLEVSERPRKFISASAIGIYQSGILHDETSTRFGDNFVGKVVNDWEGQLNGLPVNVQKNIFRIGLVLGKEAKTIKSLLTPFKLGMGGKLGSGKQPFPFIHEKDLVKAFIWAVEELNESGTYNLTAPEQITNAEFTKTLAKKLNRPAFITVPALLLKLFLGEAATLLLENPVVTPKALMEAEFPFKYPTINATLNEIISK